MKKPSSPTNHPNTPDDENYILPTSYKEYYAERKTYDDNDDKRQGQGHVEL